MAQGRIATHGDFDPKVAKLFVEMRFAGDKHTQQLIREVLPKDLDAGLLRRVARERLTPAPPGFFIDAPLARGMLITLVENAIKHGIGPWPPGGRVDVTARDAGGRLAGQRGPRVTLSLAQYVGWPRRGGGWRAALRRRRTGGAGGVLRHRDRTERRRPLDGRDHE